MAFNYNQKEPEFKKVKRSLKFSIFDASFYNIMDGFSGPFLTPFALFLNASTTTISLISALPDLFGSFFQLTAIKASEIFKSKKTIHAISAFIQACLWLPLLFIPKFVEMGLLSEAHKGLAMLILVTAIVGISSFISPIWRSLMGDLVPDHERGSFFSKRNRIGAATGFIATLGAGWLLQKFTVNPLTGFTILFLVAFFSRLLSATFVAMMYEKQANTDFRARQLKKSTFTLSRFLRELHKTDYGKFVIFVCIFRIAVSIASPFFAVYELKHLGFSYMQYTMLTAVEILATFLFLGIWGKINDNKGSKMVILLSGLLIPFVPILYLFGKNFYFLLLIGAFSGVVWGGFNLAVGNFMSDASSSEDRVRYVAYFNFLHGLAAFVGAIIGAFLLKVLPLTTKSILIVFLISGLLRLAVAVFGFPKIREMRIISVSFDRRFFDYSLFIKPRQGFVEDPFDFYMAYEKKPIRPRPHLHIDKQFLDDTEYVDPDEKREKEKILYKNFMQNMFDTMKKKK